MQIKSWLAILIIVIIAFSASAIILFKGIWAKNVELYIVKDDRIIKRQIGQMIMVGFRGTEINYNPAIIQAIKEIKMGGVILFDYDVPSKSFPRNIIDANQTKKLISDLQKNSATPLFVSVDVEGGNVNRLKEKYGFLYIKSAKQMGFLDNTEAIKNEALKLSGELKNLGFNLNFAPVVDVDINPQNPVIGALERSFSADPNKVAIYAQSFIEAMHQNNIITSVKHFPGHGSSTGDSHLGLVDVTDTYRQEELIPYEKLASLGLLDTVMTAHIINKKIDPKYPATLSPLFLQDILRNEIGFQGVIISDDMQMGAIDSQYGLQEAIIKAINAGCDIILASNNSSFMYDEELPYKIQNIIFDAVESGEISAERVGEAYNRIMNLKSEFKIIN